MADMVASIVWDKKSQKVGKLLERLADVIERQVEVRVAEELDQVFEEGYNLALEDVQRFGLPRLVEGVTVELSNNGNEGVDQSGE